VNLGVLLLGEKERLLEKFRKLVLMDLMSIDGRH
jgi:hypothetical protein